MRYLLTMMFLLATASIANAQLWKPYWYSTRGESYFDAISLERNGNRVSVRALINLSTPSIYKLTWASYLSLTSLDEIDCVSKTWSYRKTEAWERHFGEGKLIYSNDAFVSEVMAIERSQNIDELHNILCKSLKKDGNGER